MTSDKLPTLNGLDERMSGLEKIINVYIAEIKEDIKQIRENEIPHLRADIECLKKSQWKMLGGLAVVVFLIEMGIRILPNILATVIK
jgi:hypothetical protein